VRTIGRGVTGLREVHLEGARVLREVLVEREQRGDGDARIDDVLVVSPCVVNSGITVATLLSLYEDFPQYVRALQVDIPESGNAVPDLVHEALWNLRWMLTMQDPSDGGVYHKLTEPRFEGFVSPAEAKSPRYVVQKSTAAALDFAAVMAQGARVLRPFEGRMPGLSDSALTAAVRARNWA